MERLYFIMMAIAANYSWWKYNFTWLIGGLLVDPGDLFIFQTRNIKKIAHQQSMSHVEMSRGKLPFMAQ